MCEYSTHTYSLVLSQLQSVIIPLILHVHIHSSAPDATQSKILDSVTNRPHTTAADCIHSVVSTKCSLDMHLNSDPKVTQECGILPMLQYHVVSGYLL